MGLGARLHGLLKFITHATGFCCRSLPVLYTRRYIICTSTKCFAFFFGSHSAAERLFWQVCVPIANVVNLDQLATERFYIID